MIDFPGWLCKISKKSRAPPCNIFLCEEKCKLTISITLLSVGSRNSVDRAPSRCSEGHGCDSCWGFFLCPTLVSCCSIPLSHFITELKIHDLYSLIEYFLLDLLTHPLNFNFLFSCEAHGKWSRCRDLNDIQVSASPPPQSSHLVTKAAKDK